MDTQNILDALMLPAHGQAALKEKLNKADRGLEFRIVSFTDAKAVIEVKTVDVSTDTAKDLREYTKSIFGDSIGDRSMNVIVSIKRGYDTDIVTPEWLQLQRSRTGKSNLELEQETGIEATTVSALVKGHKTLTQPLKAAFYYYFMSK